MSDIFDVLRRVSLFASLSEKELGSLTTSLELSHHLEGDELVRESDKGDSLFVIITGLVSVSKIVNKKSVELSHIPPGGFFGELSLLTGMPRSATVTALTDCTLIEIKAKDLEPILKANPHIIDKLSSIQAERMRDLNSVEQMQETDKTEIKEAGLQDYLKKRISAFFGLLN